MKITGKPIAQGDIFYVPVDKMPEGLRKAKRVNGRVILALGETTGHAHAIRTSKVDLFVPAEPLPIGDTSAVREAAKAHLMKADETMLLIGYVVAENTATLEHEDHGAGSDTLRATELPAGTYQVRCQREYAPAELRRVAD